MNNRNNLSAVSALLLIAALALPTGNAVAQDAKSIAGTYIAASVASLGDNPRGQLILGSDGHYSLTVLRKTLPKIAAGARGKGTAEENKAIVGGSITHYGKYTVDAKNRTITFNVEASTFPNWDGATFKRPFNVSGTQVTYDNAPAEGSFEVVWDQLTLTYTVDAPSDGSAATDVVWKRVK